MVDTAVADRLEALIVARAQPPAKRALGELIAPLVRFAPAELAPAAWRDRLDAAVTALRGQGALDADHRVRDGELARRIGRCTARGWAELADRVLPALALGIAADDAGRHARLAGRDAWAAAVVGRALGLWRDGPPPSLPQLCDALVWRDLALPGPPRRCPPEVRAAFVQRQLARPAHPARPAQATRPADPPGLPEPPGPVDRLVRVLAAREVAAPRPELRALRDALVRGWLAGRTLGDAAAAARATPDFATDVLGAADRVVAGRFGDRKVFVSAVWGELRRDPRWADLALAGFKGRLLAAYRARELVLARADLVAAMDPALVAASEIAADGASFHFIVKEPAP